MKKKDNKENKTIIIYEFNGIQEKKKKRLKRENE